MEKQMKGEMETGLVLRFIGMILNNYPYYFEVYLMYPIPY